MPTLWEIEADYIRLLGELRETGIKRDAEFCQPKLEKGREICRQIREELGWNPGSAKQIGEFILGEMKYPVLKRTPKGNPSFDKHTIAEYEEMLEADGSDVAQKVVRYRGWQKTCSSNYQAYLELADSSGIIHPNYKPHGTVTGRCSCELPNLQQIPRESENEWNGDLKQAFIPRNEDLTWFFSRPYPDLSETRLIEFDFKQLETRLAAAVAEEQDLLDAFKYGIDVFQAMADRLSWERQNAKLFTYMTLYGAGIDKIRIIFKVDRETAREMRLEFFRAYPGLKRMAQMAQNIAMEDGYVEYWTGRRRHLPHDHRKAFNSVVQGGGYEIVKRSMLRVRQQVKYPIVLTVHDSILLEIPASECNERTLEEIKHIIEAIPEAPQMGVSFDVDYKEWGKK